MNCALKNTVCASSWLQPQPDYFFPNRFQCSKINILQKNLNLSCMYIIEWFSCCRLLILQSNNKKTQANRRKKMFYILYTLYICELVCSKWLCLPHKCRISLAAAFSVKLRCNKIYCSLFTYAWLPSYWSNGGPHYSRGKTESISSCVKNKFAEVCKETWILRFTKYLLTYLEYRAVSGVFIRSLPSTCPPSPSLIEAKAKYERGLRFLEQG